MPWFSQKIRELQAKPYEQRVKILTKSVIAAAIILILLWLLALRFKTANFNNETLQKFGEIFKNLKTLKDLKP